MVKNIVNRFAKNKGMDIKLTKKALICLLCEMGFLKGENTSKVVMANPKNINFLYIGKKGIRMEVLILDLILRKLEIMLPTQDIIEIPINGELTLQYNTITQSFNIEKLLRDTNNDLDLNEWLEGVSNEIRSFQYRGINGDIFGNAEMLDHILEMYVNEFDEIVTALEKYELAF
jgi:hypothetical protein